MTHLQILSKQEISQFDQPPIFSGEERKKYFRLTIQLQQVLSGFRTSYSQLGFLLHLGYYKASGRFYSHHSWYQKDINYVANQLSISKNKIKNFNYQYKKQLFHNHKQMILAFTSNYAIEQKQGAFSTQLQLLISKHLTPKKVFYALVDWLKIQRIEIPSYNFISSQITKNLSAYERKQQALLKRNLTANQIMLLESLLDQQKTIPYLFKITRLKHVDQSEKPGKIAQSIVTFEEIKGLFRSVEPLIEKLQFNPDTWRAYARWVMNARSKQILDLTNAHQRYLHSIAFLYHQYSYRQDCFIRILLNATAKVNNDFAQYEQQALYEKKSVQEEYEQLLNQRLVCYEQQWRTTCKIIAQDQIDNDEKITQMKNLIAAADTTVSTIEEDIEKASREKAKIARHQLYFQWVRSQHTWLKNRVGGILENIVFNETTSDKALIKAINNYRKLKKTAFCRSILLLFDEKTQQQMVDEKNRPVIPLCRALFFLKIGDAIKAGKLNLKYSYKYRSIEEYLIPKARWEKEKGSLLEKAGLTAFIDFKKVMAKLETQLEHQFKKTNQHIMEGKNEHVKINSAGEVLVSTPGIDEPDTEPVSELFEPFRYTAIGDLLLDVQHKTRFIDQLTHHGIKYTKARPDMRVFIAAIIGYGCNIGHYKMGKIAKGINTSSLLNTTNWYFNKQNLDIANDQIVNLTRQLPIHQFFRHHKDSIHTSSDGQKYNTAVESLNASHSFKYLGTGKGSTIYNFVDEAISTFYSLVITASEREATYVLDGLIHNEVYWEEDKQWLHHTDTHGQSEIMFAATNLLGISLAPRIKGLKKKKLYAFQKPKHYKDLNYPLAPGQTINQEAIEAEWDNVLRLMATIRLKETTASSVFARLSSYAKQNPLFKAMKEMGRIYRSLYILKYYDELKLRQLTEKQLNKVERSHQFAHAIFFDNNREIRLELKEDQETAMACRVIIQNAIILWNCLRISEKLIKEKQQEKRSKIIDIISNGSACTWKHVNFHGEYDFIEESMSNLRHLNLQEILDMKVA